MLTIRFKILLLLLPLTLPAKEAIKIHVEIEPAVTYQTIDGFGASDAWRCQFVGINWPIEKRERIADLLFSRAIDSKGNPEGIGLSLWRFNISAGTAEKGVVRLNLKPGKMKDYAVFLADVIEYFESEGLHFDYLSPINEPQWNWDGSSQEGSPALNEEIYSLARYLSGVLSDRRLTTRLIIGEAGTIGHVAKIMDKDGRDDQAQFFFKPESPFYIGDLPNVEKTISAHSYHSVWPLDKQVEYRHLLKVALKEANPELGYWQSEYCILQKNDEIVRGGKRDLGMPTALYVARIIHHDLTICQAKSWQWWTAVTQCDFKDGLVYLDDGTDDETVVVLVNLSTDEKICDLGTSGSADVFTTSRDKNLERSRQSASSIHVPARAVSTVILGCVSMEGIAVQGSGKNEAILSSSHLQGRLLMVRGLGAVFQPLEHKSFPGRSLYDKGAGGLNFEHIFNGTARDKKISWFTPRKDSHTIISESSASAAVLHKADESSWGVESRMTYSFPDEPAVDMHFQIQIGEDNYPLEYVASMWASYMTGTLDRTIHFYGTDGDRTGWVSFGEPTKEGFETGTISASGTEPLPSQKGSATLNVIESSTKQFILPFYYGLMDGDRNSATAGDTMAYIMMFDSIDPIRFAMWNFVKDESGNPDPHKPAWDWQFVIKNPEPGKWYEYRARVVYTRFQNPETILRLYLEWREKQLRSPHE